MKAVAGKHHREPDRRFAGGLDASGWRVTPNGEGFHPRQRHRDPEAAKERTTGELVFIHRSNDDSWIISQTGAVFIQKVGAQGMESRLKPVRLGLIQEVGMF
jgi:hypothetical protein